NEVAIPHSVHHWTDSRVANHRYVQRSPHFEELNNGAEHPWMKPCAVRPPTTWSTPFFDVLQPFVAAPRSCRSLQAARVSYGSGSFVITARQQQCPPWRGPWRHLSRRPTGAL